MTRTSPHYVLYQTITLNANDLHIVNNFIALSPLHSSLAIQVKMQVSNEKHYTFLQSLLCRANTASVANNNDILTIAPFLQLVNLDESSNGSVQFFPNYCNS